jgi:ribosomal protein S18 acetylase RimI-like enzyme
MKLSSNHIIDVRPPTFDESADILELWQESGKWLQAKGIDQWNPESFKIEDVLDYFENGSEVFLAKLNGKIAGTFIICWSDPDIWEELDNIETGYIHKLTVNRILKGLGIGQFLLSWAEEYLNGKDKKLLRLDCMTKNIRLNQYYQELGYRYIRSKIDWNINLYEKPV